MARRSFSLGALVVALALAGPAGAQTPDPARAQTLADMRQQLVVLQSDIEGLRRELSTTGGVAGSGASGTLITRVDAIESELRRLTASTEALAFRIDRIVADGTNRIADLEFRLLDLAGGDFAHLPDVPPLGGEAVRAGAGGGFAAQGGDGPMLATAERSDFDAARTAFDAGDLAIAADRFAGFVMAYPGGPLTVEAQYLRGEALTGLGNTPEAARAYLDAFTAAPDGSLAPDALLRLGESLGALGQSQEACVMLEQLTLRFPQARATSQAGPAMRRLGCM